MNHGQAGDRQGGGGREVLRVHEEAREQLARCRAELLRKAYALAAAPAPAEPEAVPAYEIDYEVRRLLDDLGTVCERFCRVH
jgi:hypothetical protein